MECQRVLHIIGKMDRAGAETMLMNLYRNIDRTLIQFDFITFTNDIGDYDAEIKALGGKLIPILARNPIERMLKLKSFLQNHPEYQIVHAHMLLSNAFHLLAARHAGVKHRISHSHSTSSGKSSLTNKLYEKWALITHRQVATYKIGCGELSAKYLFGTTKDVLLLPNAVDIQKMTSVAKESRHYIYQQFNDSSLKIIQVGRLNEVKNHQFSLDIAKRLKDLKINFTMYFIGQGPLENELKQRVCDLALLDKVKFLGVRNDITQLMASADYMIVPSLHEGFPVVLVESQTVGLTAIVSDKVSQEVDLGVSLVEFLPIVSAEVWVDSLLKTRTKVYSEEIVTNTLKANGFDVLLNTKKLTQIYINL